MSEPSSPKHEYAFYNREDYAGFFRRLLANGVDLAVLGVLLIALVSANKEGFSLSAWTTWLYLVLVYVYLTVLRASRFRTPGFRAAGIKIVSLKGASPGLLPLSLRLLWWVIGPLNFFIDLLYMTGDEHRQTIRDKMWQTYVIRQDAVPAGFGALHTHELDFMGLALLVWEVHKPDESGIPGTPDRTPAH